MICAAIPVGFCAGLFGIGGGLISVPFLFFIFETLNIEKQYLMHLTVGTAFSITIMTSFVSVFTHNKHGVVDFNLLKSFGVFVIMGVICGTLLAAFLKTKSLVFMFSIIVYLFGAYLLLVQENKKKNKIKFKTMPKLISGFLSGFVSAPMGITGAMINVPILKYFGYPIKKAIGSSAAIGFFIALFGFFIFLISGGALDSNLPLSIGFVNIPAFLIFIPVTTFMARLGARTAHRIDKNKISKLLAIFLLFVAVKFFYEYIKL